MAVTRELLAFDIETMVDDEALAHLPEPDVALGNLKDPTKIAEKQEQARAKQIERAALDPLFARVIACSWAWYDATPGGVAVETDVLDNSSVDAERDLLYRIAQRMRVHGTAAPGQLQGSCLISYNGAAFDLPFLRLRSLRLGYRGFPAVATRRWDVCGSHNSSLAHLDVYACIDEHWPNPLGYRRNLATLAKLWLGHEPPAEHANKQGYGELWRTRQFELLAKMGEWDAEMTLRLGHLCLEYL